MIKDQGFAQLSAKVLSRIIAFSPHYSILDFSMNNLGAGLDDIVAGVQQNSRVVCLRLRNNNIDCRKNQESISSLIQDHPTLTCIDLGNSEVIQNRNSLYEEGFSAVVEGIVKSENSLISEINLE